MNDPVMSDKALFGLFVAVGGFLATCVGGCYFGEPHYKIWQQRMEGEAMLAKSESSKQVMVQDAKAKEESAEFQAKAEVVLAEGVAKANKIIGESLKDNPEYLRYMYIRNLEKGDHDVIYIPTEAGMPILEATRLSKVKRATPPMVNEPGHIEHPDVLAGAEEDE